VKNILLLSWSSSQRQRSDGRRPDLITGFMESLSEQSFHSTYTTTRSSFPCKINGSRPLWFILDTGANTAALDEALAQELGLKTEGGGETPGVGSNAVQMKFLKNIKFSLPDLNFFDDEIIALHYRPNFAFQGRETDGIFSYDFLKRFVVTIDYEKRLPTVSEPDAVVQNNLVQNGAEAESTRAAKIDTVTGIIGEELGFVQQDQFNRFRFERL
jgi:Aspartyl protease